MCVCVCVYMFVYVHMYMYMYIVISCSTGSRHLACNYGKEGIFPSLQPKVGKQAALNPKKGIL